MVKEHKHYYEAVRALSSALYYEYAGDVELVKTALLQGKLGSKSRKKKVHGE